MVQLLNLHKNKPVSVLISVLLVIVLRAGNFFYPAEKSSADGVLYPFLHVEDWPVFVQTLAGIGLTLLNLFLFDFVLTRFNLMGNLSGLPVFFFAIIASLHPSMGNISPGLTALPFIVLGFWGLLNNFGEKRGQYSAFWAGLSFGFSALLYFPYIVFIPFAITSLSVMKPATGREYIALVLGLVLPFGWTYSLFFLTDYPIPTISKVGYADLSMFAKGISKSWGVWLSAFTIFGLMNLGLLNLVKTFNANKIIVRRFFTVLIILPAFLLAGIGLSSQPSPDIFWPLVFPFTILLSRLFPEIKNPGLQKLLIGILFITMILARFDFYFGGSFTFKLVN